MAQVPDLRIKKQPTQGRAKATVEALLDSAAQLLASEGYAAVSTNRVAERAGVSIGSLYEYFPNKQALIAEALARALREVVGETTAGLREALALPDQPRAGIDHWMRAMVAAMEKRDALLRAALREVPFLWQIRELRELSDMLQQVAQEGRLKSSRVVHFEDPEASTWLLMSMVWSAILQTVLYRPSHLSRERLVHTLVDMVLKLL
ncbi:MAG: TetR/AcrR family transcriptional regulator [Stagnimonas sp.]|nr:TetR/AcrR family transcriptional regulator [Stagnimonas sp.]